MFILQWLFSNLDKEKKLRKTTLANQNISRPIRPIRMFYNNLLTTKQRVIKVNCAGWVTTYFQLLCVNVFVERLSYQDFDIFDIKDINV